MTSTNILLVEDSEADQFLFKILVEEIYPDITIIQAYDGQQAQDMLADEGCNPDFIFLDINMPRMNGHEFLDSTQDILVDKNINVYVLTSSNQDLDKDKSLQYSCVKGFYEKPFEMAILDDVLAKQ